MTNEAESSTFDNAPKMDTKAMTQRVLFVDLENVQKIDVSLVPIDVRLMVFYGITQRKLPEELVVQAQPLGSRLKWSRSPVKDPMRSISTSPSTLADTHRYSDRTVRNTLA